MNSITDCPAFYIWSLPGEIVYADDSSLIAGINDQRRVDEGDKECFNKILRIKNIRFSRNLLF